MLKTSSAVSKLITINFFVYLITLLAPNIVYSFFSLHSFDSKGFYLAQLITYQFIHDTSPLHIILNMMMLYVFGIFVEKHYGHKKTLAFYLLSGVAAGILHNLSISNELKIIATLVGEELTLAGASGSVCAIIAMFALLFPDEPLSLVFISIKAKWFISVLFIVEAFSAIMLVDSVSHIAHIAGAASGTLIYFLNKIK